ncbi:MAG: hypothetical protein WA137_12185 [Methanothrix sp.]
MSGSSKDDIADFNSEREAFDALTVGSASMITIEMRHIALISFQAIVTPYHFEHHIDD